jgi:pSer/pThr/pTyr-binding forkhead associated (FHA) protein
MRKYRAKLNPGGRGLKNLAHNLVLDDRAGAKFEGSDSLIERVKRQTKDDIERLEKVDKRLDDVERQKNVALNDPRVVNKPLVDIKRNVEKMKQTDDKIKEM